jgi:phosphate starvation-inducible PhoH-like protein
MKRQKEYKPPAETGIKFELRSTFQRDVIKTIRRNAITVLIGSAGTAKTLLSTYAGIQLLSSDQEEIEKIAVVRLAREAHYENIGAMPGDILQKLSFISAPIYDNLELFMPRAKIEAMAESNIIEILPVSYLRGRSLHNTYLIVEEAQNMPREALLTALTRIAVGSKIVITCDPDQVDFERHNSVQWLRQLITGVTGGAVIDMPSVENHRHPIISEILANAIKYKTPLCTPPVLLSQ